MRRRYLGAGVVLAVAVALAGVMAQGYQRATTSGPGGVLVDQNPAAVVVDAATRHVFVVNAGLCIRPVSMRDSCGSVSMLDTGRGTALRTITVGDHPQDIALDAPLHRAVVVSGNTPTNGSVSLLDTVTGRVVRTLRLGGSPSFVVVDSRTHHAFITSSFANTVTMLDTRSGRVLHRAVVGQIPARIGVDPATGRVFVGNEQSNTVSVLDARSGRVIRTVAVGLTPAMIATDTRTARVFVMNAGNQSLTVLNAVDGAPLGVVALPGIPTAAAVDTGRGLLFVTTATQPIGLRGNGHVCALDARTGAVLRTTAVGQNPEGVAVDTRTGRMVVTATGPWDMRRQEYPDKGVVQVLDARTGALLQTHVVDVGPWFVAVDEQLGHAFVINTRGTGPQSAPTEWWLAWAPYRFPRGTVSMLDIAH